MGVGLSSKNPQLPEGFYKAFLFFFKIGGVIKCAALVYINHFI